MSENNNNNENDLNIEYMDNSNNNLDNVKSIQGEVVNNNYDESPLIELNEEEEEENEFESDEIDELKSAQNRSKEIVYENLSKRSKDFMNKEPTLVIEKLDDDGSQPSSNTNENELLFDEDENQNIDLFGDDAVVTIQENVALSETEVKYEDESVDIQELENQFLESLPVTKQSLLYVQKRIKREVMEIMKLKHYGKELNQNISKGVEYNYNNSWIIPISLDKHRIYVNLKENDTEDVSKDTNNNNNENEFIEGFIQSKEDQRGIEKVNQRSQMIKIKQLHHLAKIKTEESDFFSFKELLNDVDELIIPYLPKRTNPNQTAFDIDSSSSFENNKNEIENNNNNNMMMMDGGASKPKEEDNYVGYFLHPHDTIESIRYYDIDNIYWSCHKSLPEFYTYENELDPNDVIKGINPVKLTSSEPTNIVGFMVLPKAGIDITNTEFLFTPTNYDSNILTKAYKNVGMIENVKISDDGNSIIIRITEHNLSNDSHYIIIEDCDYVPNINGVHKSVTIIDDNTISIKNKRKINMIKEGSKGKLYSLTSLQFDKYKIKKVGRNFDKEFINSTYLDKEESNEHMKLFLFDELKVLNKDEYEKLIRYVAPTLDNIIESERDKLEKCESIEEMDEILKPYGIDSTFKLHYSQFLKMEKILEEKLRMKEEEIEKENELPLQTLTFHNKDKSLMSNPNIFLADIYISSPFIQKYYGKYIHLNKPEDSLYSRLEWVISQLDFGNLYFLYVLYENIDTFYDNNPKEYLESILNVSIQQFEELDKTLKREFDIKKKEKNEKNEKNCKLYHYEAFIIPSKAKVSDFDNDSMKVVENDVISHYLPNDTVFYMEDKLFIVKKGKKEEFKGGDIEGVMALVGDSIYVWDKKEWKKSDIVPKYHQIRYLCEFGETDIKDLDLDSMDCIYRDKTGCDTRIIGRLKDKMNQLEIIQVNFRELIEYIQKKVYKSKIEKGIEHVIFKYFSKDITSIENEMKINKKEIKEINKAEKKKEKEENEEEKEEKKENDLALMELKEEDSEALTELLSSINLLQNDDLKRDFVFQLIDKDGILIGKDIYSKKYRKKMNGICGHWIFESRIQKSSNILRRDILYNQLTTLFGDGGEAQHDVITCNHCGKPLIHVDYDAVEGYASSGAYIMSREILQDDKVESKNKIGFDQIFDCDDQEFKKILMKQGFQVDSRGDVFLICNFLLGNLCQKTGILLSTTELIDIIRDSFSLMKTVLPKDIYIKFRKDQMERKGISPREIKMREDTGDFEKYYREYLEIKKRSIIAARFLITVQTSIPTYTRISKDSICVFNSFEGKKGIEYLACIFKELKFIIFDGRELGESEEKTFERYLEQSYNDYKKSVSIQDLFRKKMNFDMELQKKKTITLDGDEPITLKRPIYEEVAPVGSYEEFREKLLKSKTAEEVRGLLDVLIKRMYFVAQQIKTNLKNFVDNDVSLDKTSSMVEKMCCIEELEGYDNYLYYIKIHSPEDSKLSEYVDESKSLSFILQNLFLQSSTLSRGLLKNTDPYPFIMNPIIVGNEDTISQSIIQQKFEIYVDEGKYAGTMREYVGVGMEAKDVKSGKTRKEILSKEYTRDEFKKLMNSIQKLNTSIPKKKDVQEEEEKRMRLEELKKEAETSLQSEIVKLVNNMALILNRKTDTKYINDLVQLIYQMGIFQNQIQVDKERMEVDNRYKIKMNQLKDVLRLGYVKKVYNQYFRTFLSMIQNNYKIDEHLEELEYVSEEESLKIQKEMRKEYDIFHKFFVQDIQIYFSDMDFELTSDEINSIMGKEPIYNYTFTDIIENSTLTNNQAAQIIILLLVKQLNYFILCVKDGTMSDMDEATKSAERNIRKCRAICEFYDVVFSIVTRDKIMTDVCYDKVIKYKNIMIQELLEEKMKMLSDELQDKDNYFAKVYGINQLKTKTGLKISDFEEKTSEEQEEIDNMESLMERREMLKEKLTEEYKKQKKDVTQAQLDEAVEQLESDLMNDERIDMEENQLGEVIDEDSPEAYDEILGDGNYGDNVGEHDGDF